LPDAIVADVVSCRQTGTLRSCPAAEIASVLHLNAANDGAILVKHDKNLGPLPGYAAAPLSDAVAFGLPSKPRENREDLTAV
jgi:hypothetical protein